VLKREWTDLRGAGRHMGRPLRIDRFGRRRCGM